MDILTSGIMTVIIFFGLFILVGILFLVNHFAFRDVVVVNEPKKTAVIDESQFANILWGNQAGGILLVQVGDKHDYVVVCGRDKNAVAITHAVGCRKCNGESKKE